jgi:hypothetical protein
VAELGYQMDACKLSAKVTRVLGVRLSARAVDIRFLGMSSEHHLRES